MGFTENAENVAEDILGKVKEGLGDLTGNEGLAESGQEDQAKANLRAAGEDVDDADFGSPSTP